MVSRAAVSSLDLAPPKPWRRLAPMWLRSIIWIDSARAYDGFLSYSWKADGKVAPLIQSLIQQFLCPWYKFRAKTIFRDLSSLPAGSSLEIELFERLDRSAHLIVLACPEAARSRGMEIEAEHWFSRERRGQVLIIVTAGEYQTWEEIRGRLLPPAVRDGLTSEPVWVTLQHRRDKIQSDPNNHQLRGELIEDLKQILLRFHLGYDWGQLRGEERRQRRNFIRFLSAVGACILAFAVIAAGLAWYANVQYENARRNLKFAEESVSALSDLVSEVARPTPSSKEAGDKVKRAMDKLTGDAEQVRLAASALLEVASLWEFLPEDYRLEQAEKVEQAFRGLGDDQHRFDHARSLDLMGVAYSGIGNYKRARESYDEAAEELKKLLKAPMQADERTRRIAALYQVHIHLGDLLLSIFKDRQAAYNEYHEALCVRDPKITGPQERSPESTEAPAAHYARMHDVAWALNKLADVSRDLAAGHQTLGLYNEAKGKLDDIGDHLWEDLRWPTARAMILTNIGVELVKGLEYDKAKPLFEEAKKIAGDLSKFQLHDIHAMALLGWIEESFGEMLFLQNAKKQSGDIGLARFKAAGEQRKKVSDLRPKNTGWRNDFERTHEIISNIEANEFDKARALIEELQQNPTGVNHRIEHGELREQESQPLDVTCPRQGL
jgi:tetratricopeptide (TPR) repeat protein